jgi:hypothetical protein
MKVDLSPETRRGFYDYLMELYTAKSLGLVVHVGDLKANGRRCVGIDLGVKDKNNQNWEDRILAADIPDEELVDIKPTSDFVRYVYNEDLDRYFIFKVADINQIPRESIKEDSLLDCFANRIPLREYLREKWREEDKNLNTPSNPKDTPATII